MAIVLIVCASATAVQGKEKEITLNDLTDKSINLENLGRLEGLGNGYDEKARQTLITGYFVTSYKYNDNGVAHGHGNEDHFGQDPANTKNFGFNTFTLGFNKRFSDHVWGAASVEIGRHDGGTETELHTGEVHLIAPIGNGIDFTLGKFLSPVSFEQEDAPLMLQATHSLVYQFASPAEMTGLMVTYPFLENLEVRGVVFNGWNQQEDNNSSKSLAFQVAYAPTRWLDAKLSYLWGAEQANNTSDPRQVVDGVITVRPWKGWLFGVEMAYGVDQNQSVTVPRTDAEWLSGQATAHYDWSRFFGTTARYSFYDDNNARPDIHPTQARTMHEVTFAPAFHLFPDFFGFRGYGVIPRTDHRISGVDLRLEYRRDWIDEGIARGFFTDAAGNKKSDRNTVIAEVVFSF
ncbi:MAG: outer membrane beta-barrel protein [Nitrospinae bacterium]|nr:outer membrane beta-barrel protein [Nitrospinota bacterium]